MIENSDPAESWRFYILGNLARLYSKKGEYQRAENLLNEVRLILDTSFPGDAKSRIILQSVFGKLYHRWGKIDMSLKMFESAIRLSEITYEKHAEKHAVLKYNFAKLLLEIDCKDFMRIYNLLLEAAEAFKKNGMTSRQISCYNLLFDFCKKHGENLKAEEFKNKIDKAKEKL